MGRRLKHKRAEPPKTAPICPGRPPGPGRGGFAPWGRQGAPDEAARTLGARLHRIYVLRRQWTSVRVVDHPPGTSEHRMGAGGDVAGRIAHGMGDGSHHEVDGPAEFIGRESDLVGFLRPETKARSPGLSNVTLDDLRADHGALPRLHPADFIGGERPYRHRADSLNGT